jgi:hypothetical protein
MARYKYNPITKEMDLVSSDNGKLRTPVFMPKDSIHTGHFFENLNCHIRDKNHKRGVMKKMGVSEAG